MLVSALTEWESGVQTDSSVASLVKAPIGAHFRHHDRRLPHKRVGPLRVCTASRDHQRVAAVLSRVVVAVEEFLDAIGWPSVGTFLAQCRIRREWFVAEVSAAGVGRRDNGVLG
jgi:hypothetical protein